MLMVCLQHRRDIGRCLDARCDALLVKPLVLPSGMGLEFLDIDNQGVNSIRNFLYSEEPQHQALT